MYIKGLQESNQSFVYRDGIAPLGIAVELVIFLIFGVFFNYFHLTQIKPVGLHNMDRDWDFNIETGVVLVVDGLIPEFLVFGFDVVFNVVFVVELLPIQLDQVVHKQVRRVEVHVHVVQRIVESPFLLLHVGRHGQVGDHDNDPIQVLLVEQDVVGIKIRKELRQLVYIEDLREVLFEVHKVGAQFLDVELETSLKKRI